jgi:FAS-associated factor 2
VLTILSRHQGSPSTSATTLLSHLDTTVLPRVRPFLDTLVQEEKARERDRQLRAEQDRAYEESRRRDREKWEREERERVERVREEREKEERERRRAGVRRCVWGVVRRREEGKGKEKERVDGEVRVVIRMPSGERVVEKVWRDESVSVLYAVVDRLLAGGDQAQAQEVEGETKASELDALVEREGGRDFWGFKIVSAYPRKVIEWQSGVKIGDVDVLVGGGQVVVERDVGPIMNGACESDEEEEED